MGIRGKLLLLAAGIAVPLVVLSAILAEDPNKVRRFVEAFKLARSND